MPLYFHLLNLGVNLHQQFKLMYKKTFRSWLLLALALALITGCLQKGEETIALPEIGTAASVIPEEVRKEFESKMELYEGTNPPDITGDYIISPDKLFYASDGNAPSDFSDKLISFYNKVGNTYEYISRQGTAEGKNTSLVTVIGNGDNFTAYFTAKVNDEDGSWTTSAHLISGSITSSGIRNLKNAFIVLKAYDPYNVIMDENEYRIFYDGDGIAKRTSWNNTKSSCGASVTDYSCFDGSSVIITK